MQKSLFILLALGCLELSAATFSNVIGFGDSNSDTGNASLATGGATPGASYFNGRFSDSNVWIEGLASSLGHDSGASLATGDNYAVGGATAGTNTLGLATNTLETQVTTYLSSTANMADAGALYVIWIGGNDIRQISPTAIPADVITDLNTDLTTLQAQITALHSAGARHFLVPNLGDLGLSPVVVNVPAESAAATFASNTWNTGLQSVITSVDSLSGTTVYTPDFNAAVSDIKANPSSYGVTNTTGRAITDMAVDPTEYMFVDDLHYASPVHAQLTTTALASIPEPHSGGLLLLSAVTAFYRRRK